MRSPTVVITGANRGLGLALVERYLRDGWNVVACCRSDESAMQLRERVGESITTYVLDVGDLDAVRAFGSMLPDRQISLLINNAGIYPEKGRPRLADITNEEWRRAFDVNVIGPIRLAQVMQGRLMKSGAGKVVFMTSGMALLEANEEGGAYAYRSSKAAMNAAAKSLAVEMEPQEIAVLLIDPGWVRTDMGGLDATLDVQEAADRIASIAERARMADSGRLFMFGSDS